MLRLYLPDRGWYSFPLHSNIGGQDICNSILENHGLWDVTRSLTEINIISEIKGLQRQITAGEIPNAMAMPTGLVMRR